MHHLLAAGLSSLFMAFTCHAQDGGTQIRPTPAVEDIDRVHRTIEQAHHPADAPGRALGPCLHFQPSSRKAVARFDHMLDGIRQTAAVQAWVLDTSLPAAGTIRLD